MSDIIGYAHPKVIDGNTKMVLTLRSNDNSVRCGCRFRYIEPEIDFTYESLTKALNKAIDKEAEETNNQFVTDERQEAIVQIEYDYEALMKEFQEIAGRLMSISEMNSAKITHIIEKYLGKNKKILDTTFDQAEFVYLIVEDLKEEFKNDLT